MTNWCCNCARRTSDESLKLHGPFPFHIAENPFINQLFLPTTVTRHLELKGHQNKPCYIHFAQLLFKKLEQRVEP